MPRTRTGSGLLHELEFGGKPDVVGNARSPLGSGLFQLTPNSSRRITAASVRPFLDYTYDDFAAMTAVNLNGFFHLRQRVVRHLAEQARGHVNITTSLVDHARVASPPALASLTKGGWMP